MVTVTVYSCIYLCFFGVRCSEIGFQWGQQHVKVGNNVTLRGVGSTSDQVDSQLLNPDREGVGECGDDTWNELRQVRNQLVLKVLAEGNQRVEDLYNA